MERIDLTSGVYRLILERFGALTSWVKMFMIISEFKLLKLTSTESQPKRTDVGFRLFCFIYNFYIENDHLNLQV